MKQQIRRGIKTTQCITRQNTDVLYGKICKKPITQLQCNNFNVTSAGVVRETSQGVPQQNYALQRGKKSRKRNKREKP